MSDYLIEWLAIMDSLSVRLSEELDKTITSENISEAYYLATFDQNNYQWILSIVDSEPNEEEIYKTIKKFPFECLRGITVPDELFPDGLLMEMKVRVKVKNHKWVIHKNDVDPFPSNPHAHLVGQGLKLDLNTGELYRGRYKIDKLNHKDLESIRKKFKAEGVTLT